MRIREGMAAVAGVAAVVGAVGGLVFGWVSAQPQLCALDAPRPICLERDSFKAAQPLSPAAGPSEPEFADLQKIEPTSTGAAAMTESVPFDVSQLSDRLQAIVVESREAYEAARQAATDAAAMALEADRAAEDGVRLRNYRGQVARRRVPEGLGRGTEENATYRGQWIEGQAHGLGVIDVAANETQPLSYHYAGYWERGEPRGYGMFALDNGNQIFGRIESGLVASGRGVIRRPDGVRYEGDWMGLAPHGEGVEWAPDGALSRAGVWSEGFLDPQPANVSLKQ